MNANLIQRSEVAHASSGPSIAAGRGAAQLRVNVIATTEKGMIAALRIAASLAAELGAQITLIRIEVVPRQLPLQRPSVPVAFLERRLYRLVCETGIVEEEVRIQLCLCRDQRDTLRRILQSHSLVVVGGQKRWWLRQERSLEKFLTSRGHQVIFVGLDGRTGVTYPCSAQSNVKPRKMANVFEVNPDLRKLDGASR
jgi:hypothetical protein